MSALIPDAVVDLLERMNLDARHVEWLRERPRHGPRAFAEFVQRIYIKPEWITKMVGDTAGKRYVEAESLARAANVAATSIARDAVGGGKPEYSAECRRAIKSANDAYYEAVGDAMEAAFCEAYPQVFNDTVWARLIHAEV